MGKRKAYLKKDREKFREHMHEFFQSIGAKPKEGIYEDSPYYDLETPYGMFEVRDVDPSDNILSVFGAFRDGPESYAKAREDGYDCNPFTGKWNFHLTGSLEGAMDQIKLWYARMLHNKKLQREIIENMH